MKQDFFPLLKIIMPACFFFLASCDSQPAISPKPRAYPRVTFPEKAYQSFSDQSDCPMSFEFPVYASIEHDDRFFDKKAPGDCWFDIIYPDFNGKVHCTYYPLTERKQYEKLRNDVFDLAYKHSKKASFIEETAIENKNGVGGFAFEIRGHAASPLQFYISDSTKHFLRGAFYINAKVNPDSLAPVQEFIKEDIWHMMSTFQWED